MADHDAAYKTTLAALRAELQEARSRVQKLEGAIVAIEDLIARPNGGGAAKAVTLTSDLFADPKVASAPTMWQAAQVVLREVGRPLHVKEIMTRMQSKGYPYGGGDKAFKSSLWPALDRHRGVFFKAAPAVYGLVEWRAAVAS